jgi:WD40 repeat protein
MPSNSTPHRFVYPVSIPFLLLGLLPLVGAHGRCAGAAPPPDLLFPGLSRDLLGDPLPPGAVARLGSPRLRHGNIVTGVAYTPDGRFAISASADRTIRVWEPATGKEAARLRTDGDLRGLTLSPNGKQFATCGAALCLWEMGKDGLPENRPRPLTTPPEGVSTAVFSPDGKWLASGAADGIRLWDPRTGREVRHLGEGDGRVLAIAFSPDAEILAAAHLTGPAGKWVGKVRLWDPATGKQVREIGPERRTIYSLAFAPDGLTLASGEDDGPKVWEVESGTPLAKFPRNLGYTACVRISPDGRRLIAGGSNFLREYSLPLGRETRTFDVGASYTYSAAFSPDGKTLLTGGTRSVTFWDWKKGEPIHPSIGHEGEIDAILFSPDGREIVTGGYGRSLYRWETATGKVLGQLTGPSHWHSTIARSPDGKTLALQGPNLSIVLLDIATGNKQLEFVGHRPPRASAHAPMGVAFSPDGKTVISSTSGIDNTIRVWESDTGTERMVMKVEKGASTIILSPDGRTLYSIGWLGSVRIWDIATGKERPGYATQPGVAYLAISPDGRRLASAQGGTVQIWDTGTGNVLGTFTGHRGYTTRLAFSADGRTLAASGEDEEKVLFWEVGTGEVRFEVSGHSGAIKGMAFSPDGRRFATGGNDTTCLVWDYWSLPVAREPVVAKLSEDQIESVWTDLGGDGKAAFRAMGRLARRPGVAVRLGERLRPVPVLRLAKLIEDLDDDSFAVRERASKELAGLGREAEGALRKAERDGKSLEVRSRAAEILRKLGTGDKSDEAARRRALRMLEVLEAADTPAARRILEALAGGDPDVDLTREAKASRTRLKHRE